MEYIIWNIYVMEYIIWNLYVMEYIIWNLYVMEYIVKENKLFLCYNVDGVSF